MLELAGGMKSNFITNTGCIVWLLCALLLGVWLLFMMKYCVNWQTENIETYKIESKDN